MDLSEAIKIKDPRQLVRHPWETARLKVIQFLLFKKKLPFAHLADIGSGDGFVLRHLLQIGIAKNFSAVDPAFNDFVISKMESWRNAAPLHLYKQIPEISTTEPIDCILLLDILEHVPDDEKLLNEIIQSKLLAENVTWLITVPAFQTLFSLHDKQLGHYRRYNLKQLLTLCKKCGLEVDQCGYFFFSLIPLRVIQKILLRFSRKESITTIESWQSGPVITRMLNTFLWLDFKISFLFSRAGIHIPGLSCYCLCH